jgi:hypothetical protein
MVDIVDMVVLVGTVEYLAMETTLAWVRLVDALVL